ncbi:hypothetical protein [Sporosarcina koreensis]|uniref:Uncharacterized protein n=1 Tax=Sporosarcina koreensis TaxID=334735 RepID=A0ABW0U0W9_9BACL
MLYIYVAYAIISALLLALLHRGSRKEWLLGVAVVCLVPVIGWSFASVWPKRAIRNDDGEFGRYMARLDEDILIKGEDIHEKVNKRKETDVVAIEEALLVNDHATRRQIMIDVLKDDAARFIGVIKTAVENEDTETSHYAVSAIMEVKRKQSLTIRRLSDEFVRHPDDVRVACEYRDALKLYMNSGFMDENTLRIYRSEYIDVLRKIIAGHDGDVGNEYEEKMLAEIECADYTEAEQTGLAYLNRYPEREEPYLYLIRLYYTINSPTALQQMIQAVKDSPVILTNRGIKIVRYWSEGKSGNEGELC